MLWARVLADVIVVLHAAYVSFVVFGLAAILLGIVFRWSWVRNVWFRAIHLIAIGDRRGRVTRRGPVPADRLGSPAQENRRADRLHGRLSRPLGPSVDLLPCRALGFHVDLHPVRPGGPGGVRPGTPSPSRRRDAVGSPSRRADADRQAGKPDLAILTGEWP